MSRIILHVDLNAFFVRCEEIVNPSLIGKPVIIGHEGRGGVVSTCSYEARKYGIHSGMPTFMAKKLYPDVLMIPGNYGLYSKKSKQFIAFVKKYTPLVEQASIDECYLDMTSQLKGVKDVVTFLKDMRNSLLKETGLKCSIGVGPTKFLAKMGSDLKKPMGITIIHRRDINRLIYPLPIESFYGIGKKTSPKLRELGIDRICDLAKLINDEDPRVKKIFGKMYYTIKDWVNGYGNDKIDTEDFDPKSIGNSTTFSYNTNSFDVIKKYISVLAKEVSDRAKKADKIGDSIQLILKDSEMKVLSRSKKIDKPTNDYNIILATSLKLLEKNLKDSKSYRLAGVTLQNLVDPHEVLEQMSIFDNYEEIKEKYATKLLIGELNRKMKKDVFKTAGDSLRDKKYGIR